MDPDTCLAEIRKMIKELTKYPYGTYDDPALCAELVEKVEALDEWLTKGGFMPRGWNESYLTESLARDQAYRDKANGYDRETGTYKKI